MTPEAAVNDLKVLWFIKQTLNRLGREFSGKEQKKNKQ